jgi:hypothetical protein
MNIEELKKEYIEYRLKNEQSMGIQTDATPYIKGYEKDFKWFESKIDRVRDEEYERGLDDGVKMYDEVAKEVQKFKKKNLLNLKSKSGGNGECVTSRTAPATNENATYLKDVESTPTKSKSGGIK